MATYKDTLGITWNIRLNVRRLRAIRETVRTKDGAPYDLLNIADPATIQQLLTDPILVVDILKTVLASERGSLSDEEFEDRHTGEVLVEAQTAVVEALADFFPGLESQALREAVRTMKKKRQEAQEIYAKRQEVPEIPSVSGV